MIDRIKQIVLHVGDQEQARSFWTEKIGFRVVEDVPYDAEDPQGPRWIELEPPEPHLRLTLKKRAGGDPPPGRIADVLFECNNLEETYRRLVERGVTFDNPPTEQMWGVSATFLDPEGTRFVLDQRSKEVKKNND